MKRIYINNTRGALVFGRTMLLPGSNVAEEIDQAKYKALASLIAAGRVEITEDTAKAASAANTQKAADAVVELSGGDAKTKAAAKRRKKTLDDLDAEVKAKAKAGR